MSQSVSAADKYFMLRWDALDGYCAIFKIPNGMREIHKPAVGVRMGSAFPDGQRFQMAKEEKGLKIGDVISNAIGYFMVSARMKALLEQHSGAEIEFLRFTLLDHRGRVASEDCYIANVIGTRDCVDLEKSDGDPNELIPGRFTSVNRLVLAEDKVDPQARLFRTSTVPKVIIVRRDLKELFEKEGVTGVTFYRLGQERWFTP